MKLLPYLIILLIFTIGFVFINNKINSIDYKIDNEIGEAEVRIYQSIENNTNLINSLIKK